MRRCGAPGSTGLLSQAGAAESIRPRYQARTPGGLATPNLELMPDAARTSRSPIPGPLRTASLMSIRGTVRAEPGVLTQGRPHTAAMIRLK